jgi:hypothetical protein
MGLQSPGSPNWHDFGTPIRESREKEKPFGCRLCGQPVATLALGSRPRQRDYKVAGQKEKSLGVKAKALQGCGPRGSQGVTSHTPESVRKCEGV